MNVNNNSSNYYKVTLSYEIPVDVINDQNLKVVEARKLLYDSLKNGMPDRYDKFSLKLTENQLSDSFNFIITFDAFFRSIGGLPMEEYCEAKDYHDKVKAEIEEFFNSVDCDYRQLSIKVLS